MTTANLFLKLMLIPAAAGLVVLPGCGSTPETGNQKAALIEDSATTLNQMKRDYPGLQDELTKAYGYAVFPHITKAGLVISGGSGNGEVYKGGQKVGTAHATNVDVGLTVGADTYSEIVLFQDQKSFENFTGNHLQFDAKATATAIKAGATAAAPYRNGVAVYSRDLGGAMLDASIGGQQFTVTADNLQPTTMPAK